ncbi:MAG: ABC transporter permease subunit [Lachnospiraceae bacterium]|nr:ABC transporter permease subunit [Lachnospiraceae bacterium]
MKKGSNVLFSMPLMKQNIKSNWVLTVVIVIVMILMSTVINYATSIMSDSEGTVSEEVQEVKEDFYSYLFAMAAFNSASGAQLSYENFRDTTDKTVYDSAFQMVSMQAEENFTVEELEDIVHTLEAEGVSLDNCVQQFEYIYALQQSKGCFSGNDLTLEEMMQIMLDSMGVPSDLIESMSEMDTGSMINQMYYTVTGLLPILLYIVIVANGLIVNQVDHGSMAYVLSTPTKRLAIVITQAVFMIITPLLMLGIVCASRILSNHIIYGDAEVLKTVMLYLGMYILIESIAGICYMGSCIFNYSRKATAFGGGLTVWFFLASLLGMFGTKDLVNMGVGVEELGVFNQLTLIGLYDINAIGTIATDEPDDSFVWKLAVLGVIALVTYVTGAVRFQKKDLPL